MTKRRARVQIDSTPVGKPKASTSSGRSSLRGPILVLALGILSFSAGVAPYWLGEGRKIPVPEDLAFLEPVLQETIRKHVEAARRRPTDPETHGNLALLYDAHGYPELAARCYAAAVAADESSPRWRYHWAVLRLESGDVPGAERDLRHVISRQPEYAPAHQRLGLLLLDRNEYDEAARSFQTVVELRPNEVQGYVSLARAKLELGQDREVVDLLSRALTIAADKPEVHYLLGRAYRHLGRNEEADIALTRGGKAGQLVVRDPWRDALGPLRLTRWMRLDQAGDLMAEGKTASAVEALEKLLADYPDKQDVTNKLALAYSQLHRPGDALRLLTDAVGVHKNSAPAHVNLALFLASEGNLVEAMEYAEKATTLAPSNARAHSTKGKIQLRLGKAQEALDSFREAFHLDESYPDIRGAIALTLVHLGRWEAAVEAYEDAVRFNPRSADDRYRLGLLYQRAGRVEDARAMLRAAHEQKPDDSQIRRALEQVEASLRGG